MTKEVQMTFRVEPQLRAAFTEAALRQDRPAAQVLRELMRTYINQAREHGTHPANDAVSLTESRQRVQALDFARTSVGLEGFKPHKADAELSRQYLAGEITISDAIRAVSDSVQE